MEFVLNPSPVFNIKMRPLADDAEARYMAQCIASCRDPREDGIYDPSTELNFWTARANTCREAGASGVAFGVFVNGGSPVGGILGLFLQAEGGQRRMEVYCCNSLIDRESIESAMRSALRSWASENNVQLLHHVYTSTDFGPNDTVFDGNNAVLLGAVRVVHSELVPF